MIPLSKTDSLEETNSSGLFFSIGVLVGVCLYKYLFSYIKGRIFRFKRVREYTPIHQYENAKQFFRNRFEDKLKLIDVANLKTENTNEVDKKLIKSVRASTIERIIEEYP